MQESKVSGPVRTWLAYELMQTFIPCIRMGAWAQLIGATAGDLCRGVRK